MLSLVGTEEIKQLGVVDLGARAGMCGLEWHHLPIADFGVPDACFEVAWRTAGPALHDHLTHGRSVLVHCRAGLGRSGLIAARLLVERGAAPDRAIQRAGELCRRGGFTVVKVAKPQQDMRFDVPTVGVTTIETMHAAGATVLAVEAGRTILLDEPETVALADRYGIAIAAVTEP